MTAPIASPPSIVKDVLPSSGRDLIHGLYRQDAQWGPEPRNWIFRGQADQRWPLLPKAFRASEHLDLLPGGTSGPKTTHGEQMRTEWALVLDFMRIADRAGLLPAAEDDTVFHRESWLKEYEDKIEEIEASGVGEWPFRRLVPNLALAQHHGVPTRFLDWSEDPMVAAYFAASEAAEWAAVPGRGPSGANRFTVWALNLKALETLKPALDVEVVYVSRARNHRLRAQVGVFTVVRENVRSALAFKPEPLDNAVRRAGSSVSSPPKAPVMITHILPLADAPEVLRLLNDEGYASARIYGDHDGVARAIREKRWRDR